MGTQKDNLRFKRLEEIVTHHEVIVLNIGCYDNEVITTEGFVIDQRKVSRTLIFQSPTDQWPMVTDGG